MLGLPTHVQPSENTAPSVVAQVRPTRWYSAPWHALIGLFWPSRFAPRLARSSWSLTWGFHAALLVMCALGCAAIAFIDETPDNLRAWWVNDLGVIYSDFGPGEIPTGALNYRLTWGERLRSPFAAFGMDCLLAAPDWPVPPWVVLWAHAAAWVIALLLAPLVAVGSGQFRFGTALKLTLWSSAAWLPTLLGAGVATWICHLVSELWFPSVLPGWLLAIALLGATCWLMVAARLVCHAGSVAGENTPANSQHESEASLGAGAQCVRCSYQLAGLDEAGRCPECGWPVATSLGLNRVSPPWELAPPRKRAVAWSVTSQRVLRDRDFFRRLAASRSPSQPLAYLLVCALVAAMPFWIVELVVMPWTDLEPETLSAAAIGAAILVAGSAFVLFFMLGCLARFILVSRYGRIHAAIHWSAVCYGATWALPVILAAYVTFAAALWAETPIEKLLSFSATDWLDVGAALMLGRGLVVLVLGLGTLVAAVYCLLRSHRALRDARLGDSLAETTAVSR